MNDMIIGLSAPKRKKQFDISSMQSQTREKATLPGMLNNSLLIFPLADKFYSFVTLDDGTGEVLVVFTILFFIFLCGHAMWQVTVWRVQDFSKQPIPKEMYGQFFGGDS